MENNQPQPLVTVLMPAYNAALHIKDAIDSILTQTYSNFEFLVINDGSTDETANVVKQFVDQRIRLVNNEVNLGLIDTLNKGLKLAQGKYIVRMDADDISLPDRIQLQVDFMEENPDVDICGGYFRTFGSQHVTMKHPQDSIQIHNNLLFKGSMLAHPTVIMRSDFLSEHSLQYPAEYKHTEDYALWLLADKYGNLRNLPRVLILYRNHAQQISTAKQAEQSANTVLLKVSALADLANLNARETELTRILLANEKVESTSVLAEIRNVLTKLDSANTKSEKYDMKEFKRFLDNYFYDFCERNADLGKSAVLNYHLFSWQFFGIGRNLGMRLKLLRVFLNKNVEQQTLIGKIYMRLKQLKK